MPEQRIVEVVIGFDLEEEEITYIKSDFEKESLGFKNPIEYTVMLLQMALEKWIKEKIGVFCPECGVKMSEGWVYCPKCGWDAG